MEEEGEVNTSTREISLFLEKKDALLSRWMVWVSHATTKRILTAVVEA